MIYFDKDSWMAKGITPGAKLVMVTERPRLKGGGCIFAYLSPAFFGFKPKLFLAGIIKVMNVTVNHGNESSSLSPPATLTLDLKLGSKLPFMKTCIPSFSLITMRIMRNGSGRSRVLFAGNLPLIATTFTTPKRILICPFLYVGSITP